MDLPVAAAAFATIVGLLSNFKSEQSSGDLKEFIAWLKEKRHEDVGSLIESNANLLQQLAAILSSNHEELVAKLASLDKILSSVAAHTEGFSGLALSIHPRVEISEQAFSILRQIVESGAKLFMECKITSGNEPDEYLLMEGANGKIKYDEPRFMEDDLKTLIRLGFLNLEIASRGSRRFLVTREAVRFIRAADG